VDKDKEVKKWLKNPRNQIAIRYKFGNYYPDFIIETEKEMLLVEVKSSAELKKEEVLEKAREADNWCKVVSKITSKKWSYKLLPHDKINRQDSFKATISNVIKHK
jgi:type III restriction enzyme